MKYTLRESVERGIKLSIGPRFRLPDIPGEPLVPRVFTTTYFDTPSYALARLGIALRRRTENRKVRWQLQLPQHQARLELEIPENRSTPPEPFLDLLFGILRKETCSSVAKLHIKRSGIQVNTLDGPLANIVADRVTILDGRRTIERFSEIEIELLGGNKKELKRLESLLRAAGAEDGDPRTKVIKALGIQLEADPPRVHTSAAPIDHIKAMLQQEVKGLLFHDPGTRFGKDPEELHHMRVSTRRFRALLRVGRVFLLPEWSDTLLTEVGWLGQVLGVVRDYDVLLEYLHHEGSFLLLPERNIFEGVLTILETPRSVARAQLLEALRSDRYLKLLNHLEEAIQYPMVNTSEDTSLQQLARKEFNTLRRVVQHLGADPSDQELHRVRIRTKQARYAAELAQGTMGKAASRFIQQTKRVQDLLGDHQDTIIAEKHLQDLLAATRGVKAAFAMGQVVERLRSRRRQARANFPREWTKLRMRGRLAYSESS